MNKQCRAFKSVNLTNYFVSIDQDGSLLMWDQRNGLLFKNLTNPQYFSSAYGEILFNSNDSSLIVGYNLGIANIIRLNTNRPAFKDLISSEIGTIFTNLQLLSNGNLATAILSTNYNHYLGIYNLSSGALVSKVKTPYVYGITSMKVLANDRLFSGDWFNIVYAWSSNLDMLFSSISTSTLVLITLDDDLVAIGSWEYNVYIINSSNGAIVYTLQVKKCFKLGKFIFISFFLKIKIYNLLFIKNLTMINRHRLIYGTTWYHQWYHKWYPYFDF
jgi:hypothetical protein